MEMGSFLGTMLNYRSDPPLSPMNGSLPSLISTVAHVGNQVGPCRGLPSLMRRLVMSARLVLWGFVELPAHPPQGNVGIYYEHERALP